MKREFVIKIAGPAGFGIKSLGDLIQRGLAEAGFTPFGYPEYPSLVRGGHNTVQISLRSDNNPCVSSHVDLLVALNNEALNAEKSNISSETIVLTPETLNFDSIIDQLGNSLILNTLFAGFLTNKLQLNKTFLKDQLSATFKNKNKEIQDINQKAFDLAFDLATSHPIEIKLNLPTEKSTKICITGNEAIGEGAVAAGIDLYTVYPMTPSTGLLHFLAPIQKKHNFIVHQIEDEIAAINMAIGASFAGGKAMTGTSGGGFALMQEGISLSGMMEIPLVVYLAMRPGPATGMPTWTSQGDLLFAVFSGHGEFPKIVLAPSNAEEAYLLSHKSFELSQEFHCPVILISDKYLAESLYTIPRLEKLDKVTVTSEKNINTKSMYPRYQLTSTGISPRTLPGTINGEYDCNSDEHDIYGFSTESAADRELQNKRRQNRMASIKSIIPLPKTTLRNSDTCLLTWGSHLGIGQIVADELEFDHVHFSYIYPFPEKIDHLFAKYKKIISLENNLTGQFGKLLTMETSIRIDQFVGTDNGRPINTNDIMKLLKS